jgi:PTH2 family peptidyl-tRNA hydrolase
MSDVKTKTEATASLAPAVDGAEGRAVTSEEDAVVKMYIVVNADLTSKMGKGKLCGQVGHAVAAWMRKLAVKPTDAYTFWVDHLEPKIVKKAPLTVLEALKKKYPTLVECVHDAGKTQIPAGSFTVLAFPPLPQNLVPTELHALKLL